MHFFAGSLFPEAHLLKCRPECQGINISQGYPSANDWQELVFKYPTLLDLQWVILTFIELPPQLA
jgi:hypothetical protein